MKRKSHTVTEFRHHVTVMYILCENTFYWRTCAFTWTHACCFPGYIFCLVPDCRLGFSKPKCKLLGRQQNWRLDGWALSRLPISVPLKGFPLFCSNNLLCSWSSFSIDCCVSGGLSDVNRSIVRENHIFSF